MFGFRSMKDIKKRLKRRRRPLWTLGLLAGIFITAAASGIAGAWLVRQAVFDAPAMAVSPEPMPAAETDKLEAGDRNALGPREIVLQALAHWRGDVDVMLRRVYWCGEETHLLGRQTTKEASDLLKSRRDWEASFDAGGRLILVSTEENSSPACRQNAYIGLDANGNLSLFDGPPRKDNVVRTFYQLDVHSLESSMSPEMLQGLTEGIKVADPIKLSSVLSDYRDYASHPSTDVMKRE